MALIDYNLFGKIDKVQMAIDRLKAFEPEDGYIVADSGGKDSTCIVTLAQMAGVKHECVYNSHPRLPYTLLGAAIMTHLRRRNTSRRLRPSWS